jgi:hypothetical protein
VLISMAPYLEVDWRDRLDEPSSIFYPVEGISNLSKTLNT